MATYLTTDEFKLKTLVPVDLVDRVEARTPGWLAEQLALVSAYVSARLRKRYGEWSSPYPYILGEWITHVVSLRVLLKGGVRADDEQYVTYKELHDQALKDITEAANGQSGLFDIALQDNASATGITRGGPASYTEASPYVGFDVQAELGREEDSAKEGSYR